MRATLIAFVLVGCSAGAAQTGCMRDQDCILVDVCGCSCTAARGPTAPPAACEETCQGHPCGGHHAACVAHACAMR